MKLRRTHFWLRSRRTEMDDRPSRELARQWDARDLLGRFRKQFSRPAGQIYLQGGSLGLCSQPAERALLRALADWKGKAHEEAATTAALGEAVGHRIAGLVGAAPEQIALVPSVAAGLQQLLGGLYRRQFHRPQILLDAFSDAASLAALQSHLELRGLDGQRALLIARPNESWLLDEEAIAATLSDPSLQMAFLPVVVRATGQRLNVVRLARIAREAGVLFGLDLSHSFGVIPHQLEEWGADFAVWEHGLFASGGPSAPAGLFLHRRHFARVAQTQSRPDEDAEPNDGAESAASVLRIGAPPLLSLAPLDGSLHLLEEAGPERLRSKSLDLTQFLRCTIEAQIPTLDLLTPRAADQRGGHLALYHPAAEEICRELRRHGVSADHYEPWVISLAPSPLYNSFVECWDAVQILRRVLEAQAEAACPEPRELVS